MNKENIYILSPLISIMLNSSRYNPRKKSSSRSTLIQESPIELVHQVFAKHFLSAGLGLGS